jgi:NACHT domain
MSAAPSITKAFDPAIVTEHYPAPIAHAYAALQQDSSPLERLFALKDLFEVSLKYCAIVMVQDYLRLGISATPVDAALAQYLTRPQLGNWNHILREVARTCQRDREQLFIPELADFYFELWGAPRRRGHELVDELIKFRNRVIAHGARPRGREAEQIFASTEPLMQDFLGDLLCLREHELFSPRDEDHCDLHMGVTESVSVKREAADSQLSLGRLYLRRGEGALSLYPLLLYQRCGSGTPPEVCEQQKIFFFNGGERRPEYIDYLMGHAKQVVEVADALQQILSASKERLSIELREPAAEASGDLIRESVRGFVGRTGEELELLDYVVAGERGHLTIEGDPGVGKSALLSQIVLDLTKEGEADIRSTEIAAVCGQLKQTGLAVATHVCTRRVPESISVPEILASLTKQLVKQYGPPATVPQERSLRSLLDVARVAKSHFLGKALLIIDGLDEALAEHTAPEQREIINSLPVSGLLPDGVFTLVSTRRGYLDHESAEGYRLELVGLTRDDIRKLLSEVADRFSIAESDVAAVQHVSQGNSLYVRMLVNDLKLGKLDLNEINRLPQGLEGYFEDFIKRLSVDPDWPVLRDCLLLLAIARGHLSVNQVCAMTDLTWAEVEAAMEDKLQAVLVSISPEIRDYQVFHEKFREFLLGLFSGKLSAEVATRLNRYFVREAAPRLRAQGEVAAPIHLANARERLLNYCRRWHELDDDYPYRNLPRHLYDAGAVEELETLLRHTDFAQEKIKRLSDATTVAEDVRYLTLALLQGNREDEIVELAISEHGYYRDGVASALRVAGADLSETVARIVRALLQRSDVRQSKFAQAWSSFRARLPGRPNLPVALVNCRRVAIEVSYRLQLSEMLVLASQDDAAVVRALLVPYLYRFWNRDREAGRRLMDLLAQKTRHRTGLPSIRTIEAYGGLCMAILIYHGEEPEALDALQVHWRAMVRRLLHIGEDGSGGLLVRYTLRAAIFAMTRMLRLTMASQPAFTPINLHEMSASTRRNRKEELRVGLQILEHLEHPELGFAEPLEILMNKQLPFGLYLMLVVERTLIFHGVKDPGAMLDALYRVHREGCEWFRQSALYIGYHSLNANEHVEDAWLEQYARLNREIVNAHQGTFKTEIATYDLLPHIAACEIIFDKFRPQGGARFIPEFYAEAKRLGDQDYARRVINAVSLLSFGYRRHELALDALRPALTERDPVLRQAVIESLAGIRFHAEDVVDRFLESERAGELAEQVASHTLALKSNDIFVWIDPYIIRSLIKSDWFRAELVGAFRRAGHARSLAELTQQVLKWVINLSSGESLLPL